MSHDINHERTVLAQKLERANADIENLKSKLRDANGYLRWYRENAEQQHPTVDSVIASIDEVAGRLPDPEKLGRRAYPSTEQRILNGETVVYPGHPVVLAYIIMHRFRDLETANAPIRSHDKTPAALTDHAIPGAGGDVYTALRLLNCIEADIETPESAAATFSDLWKQTDASGHPKKVQEDQDQADRFRSAFVEKARSWFGLSDPAPASTGDDACAIRWCESGEPARVPVNDVHDDASFRTHICACCADALGLKAGDDLPDPDVVKATVAKSDEPTP